jgi:hypothetical protein
MSSTQRLSLGSRLHLRSVQNLRHVSRSLNLRASSKSGPPVDLKVDEETLKRTSAHCRHEYTRVQSVNCEDMRLEVE